MTPREKALIYLGALSVASSTLESLLLVDGLLDELERKPLEKSMEVIDLVRQRLYHRSRKREISS